MILEHQNCARFLVSDQSALVISLLLELIALMDENVTQPRIWHASVTLLDIESFKKSQLRAEPCANAKALPPHSCWFFISYHNF
jgi:hypothetical protein